MPNSRELMLSSRSFGLSEKTTPWKLGSEFTPFEVYLKKRRRMSGNSAIVALDGKGRGGRLVKVVSYSYGARS